MINYWRNNVHVICERSLECKKKTVDGAQHYETVAYYSVTYVKK
jgi:hypothetical protein